MSAETTDKFRCAVLSVVKHAYVPNGVASHPRFELVVVADDPDQPDWVHERNQLYADQHGIPYIRDIEKAIRDYDVQVAVVSSEAERHCDLSVRAADAGLHVVLDKPMSTQLSECDRLVEAVERNAAVTSDGGASPSSQHRRRPAASPSASGPSCSGSHSRPPLWAGSSRPQRPPANGGWDRSARREPTTCSST